MGRLAATKAATHAHRAYKQVNHERTEVFTP